MSETNALLQILQDPMLQVGALAIVGILLIHFLLKRFPITRLVAQVLFFILLTALLLYHGIVPYQPEPLANQMIERVFVSLAKIIWWLDAAWALVGFVRVYVKFEGQPREGRLVQDLIVALIYLGAGLSIVSYVFGVPVGTLIATSGVFAIILGLALQSTLNDVFSGIALNLGRPYAIGDWIVLSDKTEGTVVETNWRSTHLLNSTNDLVVLPNSFLAKVGLTNLTAPDPSHGVSLTVRVSPTALPSVIAGVMRAALLNSSSALPYPRPDVQIKDIDAVAVELELSFRVATVGQAAQAKNEVIDLVYRPLRAAGLSFAGSAASPTNAPAPEKDGQFQTKRKTPLSLLDVVPLFSSLNEEEKETLAASMKRRAYKKDEQIIEQGDTATSLTIVRAGAIVATRIDEGKEREVGRLAPGDYFGETGLLLNVGEVASLRALTPVVVYEIDQSSLASLLQQRSALAEELATTLSQRVEFGQSITHDPSPVRERTVPSLVARMRKLFSVP
jgi:small-conductance mechanosensitive channel